MTDASTPSTAAPALTGGWTVGTVTETTRQTPTARSLKIDVPGWAGNIAGQHVDVRLTAPDGYQAVRSYSLASSGPGTVVELAVDELPDGEVSPYLVEGIEVGDQLELRGPLGGWFVWRTTDAEPVQLIGGGSGVVPLMSMVRAHAASGSAARFRMLYSVRTPGDVFFAEELAGLAAGDANLEVDFVYTRATPAGWPAKPGRVSRGILESSTAPAGDSPTVFVCGPTGFVETVANILVELGHRPADVKTERFGGK